MKLGKQSVFYNAFFLCMSSIGLQLIGFVYRIGLSRFGGAEVMGMYQLIMPAYSVIMSFTMSGLTLAVSRLCAQYQAAGDSAGVRGVVRFSQLVFLCLFACAAIPVCLFPDLIAGVVLGEPKIKVALLLLLPCLFLTGFENIFKSCFHGIKYILPPIVSELTEQIVRTIAGLGLLLFLCPEDPGAATAMIVLGMVISEVFSVVILTSFYKKTGRRILPKREGHLKIPKGMFRRVAAIAVPVSSAGLLNNFLSSATTILIPNRLMAAGVSAQEAMSSFGVMVGMTMPLLMLPTAFIHPLNTVLLPRFSQYSAKNNEAQTRRKAGKAIQITSILISVSLSIMLPLGNELAQLIYHQSSAGEHIFALSVATYIKEFGSVEQWKAHYMERASQETMQRGYQKLVEWYGSKEAALDAAMAPPNQELVQACQKRLDAVLEKLNEKRKRGCPLDSFEVRESVGEYEFVMKRLYQMEAKEGLEQLMLSVADSYRHEMVRPKTDAQYGEGAAEFFAQAIASFYKRA